MPELNVKHWQYLHGSPLFSGKIKQQLTDFKVFESLSFSPSGEGEHVLLQIEKTGLNTAFVAEQLAKFANLPLRAVTYAGRKDKFASTTQWFGVHAVNTQVHGFTLTQWQQFPVQGANIIACTHNQKKLRTGAISSNQFEIVIRGIDKIDASALEARVAKINVGGVPNYYGNQRFGELIKPDGSVLLGGNLQLAEKLSNGEEIKNRNKRSMAISALRSWLFNEFVSQRIENGVANQLLAGDVVMLSGTNSFFVFDEQDPQQIDSVPTRLAEGDLQLSAPLWGKGKLQSMNRANDFETSIADRHSLVTSQLEDLGLEQQRRQLIVFPKDFHYEISDNSVLVKFNLPTGCFATSVIREIADVSVGNSGL